MALIKDISLAFAVLVLLILAFLAGFYLPRPAHAQERATGANLARHAAREFGSDRASAARYVGTPATMRPSGAR
jgi:hypothetical protein